MTDVNKYASKHVLLFACIWRSCVKIAYYVCLNDNTENSAELQRRYSNLPSHRLHSLG